MATVGAAAAAGVAANAPVVGSSAKIAPISPAAVQTYLSQVGMVGSTTLCNATTVEVSVRTSYKTKVLSIIGIDSFPITVSGEATLVTGQQQPNSE